MLTKIEIIDAVNSRLESLYGVDLKKIHLAFDIVENRIGLCYSHNNKIVYETIRMNMNLYTDLRTFHGFDPDLELVSLLASEVVCLLPKNMFTSLSWITTKISPFFSPLSQEVERQ